MLINAAAIQRELLQRIEEFGDITKVPASSRRGGITLKWLLDSTRAPNPSLQTGNRAYQREVVATISWMQEIMRTVLSDGFKVIPEIHIRVSYKEGNFWMELVDGQQRVVANLQFLNGKWTLPNNLDTFRGEEIQGKSIQELENDFPNIFDYLMNYELACVWYLNLGDQDTSDLFINVLNNVNGMKAQEMRNAKLGGYSTSVRNWARPVDGKALHKLFEKVTYDKGTKEEKTVMKWFSEKGFKLNGHMELDEWISEMCYFSIKGWKKGLTQPIHTNWVTETQEDGGKYKETFIDETTIKKVWDLGLKIMKSAKKQGFQHKMTPMVSQVMILYARDILARHKIVDFDAYVKAWMDTYTKYSNPDIYGKLPVINKDGSEARESTTLEKPVGDITQIMTQFSKLFGGKGQPAIRNIRWCLDKEFNENMSNWGVLEIDLRETFPHDLIWRRFMEVGQIDEYTGTPLKWEDVAGDHDIPRSWGILKGGVTEYVNLRITSRHNNLRKGSKSGKQFMQQIAEEKTDPKAA